MTGVLSSMERLERYLAAVPAESLCPPKGRRAQTLASLAGCLINVKGAALEDVKIVMRRCGQNCGMDAPAINSLNAQIDRWWTQRKR